MHGTTKTLLLAGTILLVGSVIFLGGKNRLFAALGKSPLRFPYKRSALGAENRRSLEERGFRVGTRDFEGTKLVTLERGALDASCLLLFFPGNDEHPLESAARFIDAVDPERRCAAKSIAYRGYDSSEGSPSAEALESDTRLFIERALSDVPTANELHLVGFSLGTIVAANAVETARSLGRSVSSLVLLAPARGLSMLPTGPFSRLHPGHQYRFPSLDPGSLAKILLLQGGKDEAFHGPGEGRALRSSLGAIFGDRLSYEEYPALGHGALLESPSSEERVRHFFGSNRSSPKASASP